MFESAGRNMTLTAHGTARQFFLQEPLANSELARELRDWPVATHEDLHLRAPVQANIHWSAADRETRRVAPFPVRRP